MAKSFFEQHPPRFDRAKMRLGPTPKDLEEIPPATREEWERDGYILSPLPPDIAEELERREKLAKRKGKAAE